VRVYITPAGKTALAISDILERPKEEFEFDLAVMLVDNVYISELYEKYQHYNLIIVPISNPYFGEIDYLPTIRRLAVQILLYAPSPKEVVINSSGGTEKMTNIIKDVGDILSTHHRVTRVFGVYDRNSREVIFTHKPTLNPKTEYDAVREEADSILKLQEELSGTNPLDFD
jgi:hypothetical protein